MLAEALVLCYAADELYSATEYSALTAQSLQFKKVGQTTTWTSGSPRTDAP